MERILVVEDEKPIADLVRLALTDEGYHCQCVYDGAAAADLLECFEAYRFLCHYLLSYGSDGHCLFYCLRFSRRC